MTRSPSWLKKGVTVALPRLEPRETEGGRRYKVERVFASALYTSGVGVRLRMVGSGQTREVDASHVARAKAVRA